ncbi:MAG: preprotein translocase subunit YajC [Bacteroidaceae bacterium]|nr:preprotein translocase subunit YajC [Bacteroidaceae bacterium]
MITLLQAQGAAGGGGMSFLFMMVIIFGIMWFFMIRPQQKKQKEIQNFRNSIVRGSKIVTAGGIYGTVKDIDEAANTLKVEIANGICIIVDKGSVFASPQANIQ